MVSITLFLMQNYATEEIEERFSLLRRYICRPLIEDLIAQKKNGIVSE